MEIAISLSILAVFAGIFMWMGESFLESLMTASIFFIISLGSMSFYQSVKESSDNQKELRSQAHEATECAKVAASNPDLEQAT